MNSSKKYQNNSKESVLEGWEERPLFVAEERLLRGGDAVHPDGPVNEV